jgi:hypothetical protein
MEYYGLTPRGYTLARSTNSPTSPTWKIIHYLDLVHYADRRKIVDNCHLSDEVASVAISELKRRGCIKDTSSTVEV